MNVTNGLCTRFVAMLALVEVAARNFEDFRAAQRMLIQVLIRELIIFITNQVDYVTRGRSNLFAQYMVSCYKFAMVISFPYI